MTGGGTATRSPPTTWAYGPRSVTSVGIACAPTSPHSVDWLRICYREGWLGKPRRNHKGTERKFKDRATAIAEKLAKMRVRMGIMGAYGSKAEELGLGERTPPSRRARGTPAT
jgi:hypothetical protein